MPESASARAAPASAVFLTRDGAEVDLDLGQSQNIGGGRHVGQKVSDGGLGSKEGDSTGGSDHEVGEGAVGGVARSALVLAKVRDVGSLAGGGVVETLLLRETSGGCHSRMKWLY